MLAFIKKYWKGLCITVAVIATAIAGIFFNQKLGWFSNIFGPRIPRNTASQTNLEIGLGQLDANQQSASARIADLESNQQSASNTITDAKTQLDKLDQLLGK